MSELRFGSLCLISINESTRPFALFMLLGCMVLWWWLAQFNYGFLFRKPLCLFVRPSLMIAELIIVTRIPYLSLYRPLSHPFSIISFSSWGTLVHSTVFHYKKGFRILPYSSCLFCLFPRADALVFVWDGFFEMQWSEVQCSTWIYSGWIYSIKKTFLLCFPNNF